MAILIALVAALNAAIDPYGILATPRIPGLTAEKIAAADRPRLTKPYLVDQAQPATLLLGASNVDVGINPDSAAWPLQLRPVFNLAIDGSDAYTQHRFLQHALVHNHPKLVLLGLSLEDAMIMPRRRVTAAASAQYAYEPRLHVLPNGGPNPGYTAARLEDTAFATLSTQALTDSLLTLLRQRDPERNQQTALGWNNGGSFIRWTRTEGAYALVAAKDREKTPQFLTWAADARTTTAPIADIIRTTRAAGAEIIVFILPSYVDELEIFRQARLTPRYQAWKTEVATIVQQASAGGLPVPLWDFGGYSPYTTEPLPAPGDTRTALQWFWEPIHFRAALGDLIIRRLLTNDGPADLGARITPETLPAHFAAYDAAQRAWVAAHPNDVARLAAVIDAAARYVCHGPISACPKPTPPFASATADTRTRP